MARKNCSILTKGKSFVTKKRRVGRGRFGLIYTFVVARLLTIILDATKRQAVTHTTPTSYISFIIEIRLLNKYNTLIIEINNCLFQIQIGLLIVTVYKCH